MVAITHTFASVIADDPAAVSSGKIVPQAHWNANHAILLASTSRLVGRKTAGAGTAEEVSLSELLDFIGSAAQGDILYRGAANWERLAASTAGYVLMTQGAAANPSWGAPNALPVADTTIIIKGSADATKQLRFEVDGFTAGATRVITPPDYDGTIATLAGAETFTNKDHTDCTANTQSAGNNTTKIATTAFVTAAVAATSPVTSQSTPADQSSTTSNTAVMLGLAGTITPTGSGKILLIISGDMRGTSGSAVIKAQLSYGTSSAPANGAALTGTQVGSNVNFAASTETNEPSPFSCNAIISGLTPATAYWLDLAFSTTAGTASIKNVSITAYELK